MKPRAFRSLSLLALLAVAAPSRAEPLDNAFQAPPDSAKPWTYWYWLAGHISAGGVSRDVEAMARNGIEFGLFNSPGWSQSGGPWVTPEEAMQIPVATESIIGPVRLLLRP